MNLLRKEAIFIVSLFIGIGVCSRVVMDFSESDPMDVKNMVKINDIYKDCGSETGSINNITITGCSKAPCIFERGKNYTLDLDFNSKVDTQKVVNHVYGVIAKVPVPFPLPNDNGCSMGINCPVKNGDNLKESVTLPVLNEYPKINLYVKWQVIDDKNKQMICFLFPVALQ